MINKLVIIGISILLLCIGFIGCTEEVDNTNSDCLYLSFVEFPQIDAICYSYKFSNNNSTVTLTNESLDTLILTKQMEH